VLYTKVHPAVKTETKNHDRSLNKNSSGDETANVNFFTTT